MKKLCVTWTDGCEHFCDHYPEDTGYVIESLSTLSLYQGEVLIAAYNWQWVISIEHVEIDNASLHNPND